MRYVVGLIFLITVFFSKSLVHAKAILLDALPLINDSVVVDGDLSDWSGAMYTVDGEDVVIGVRYNEKTVYIALYPRSEVLKKRIITRGTTLWINDAGKKKERFGVKIDAPDMPFPDHDGTTEPIDNHKQPRIPVDMTYAFVNGRNELLSAPYAGIVVAVSVVHGRFSLEIAIPRQDFEGDFLHLKDKTGVTIGVEIPAGDPVAMADRRSMNGLPNNDFSGDFNGNKPRRDGTQPSNPGRNDKPEHRPIGREQSARDEMYEKLLLWFRVTIPKT